MTPYSLRHKFATDLLAAGTDPGTVAKLMGHTSTDMIFAHYQHVMTKQKIQAIEALPVLNVHTCSNLFAQANSGKTMDVSKAVQEKNVHKTMCATKKRAA